MLLESWLDGEHSEPFSCSAMGLAPSMMFQWRRAMEDATKKNLKTKEKIVTESEIRVLERALGKCHGSAYEIAAGSPELIALSWNLELAKQRIQVPPSLTPS